MTMKWSFFYNSFFKIDYNITPFAYITVHPYGLQT